MYLYVLFRRQTRAYHTRIVWHREEQHDIGASLVLGSYNTVRAVVVHVVRQTVLS